MRPRCYAAGPLGFTAAGRLWLAERWLPALARVVEVVDPWALTSADEVAAAAAEGRRRALWLEVAERNAAAIRSCACVAALLDGQEVDSGTAAEVGYAAALGLPVFALRTDLRRAGEPDMAVNLQVEGFVVQSGGLVAATLDELVDALAGFAAG